MWDICSETPAPWSSTVTTTMAGWVGAGKKRAVAGPGGEPGARARVGVRNRTDPRGEGDGRLDRGDGFALTLPRKLCCPTVLRDALRAVFTAVFIATATAAWAASESTSDSASESALAMALAMAMALLPLALALAVASRTA